MIPLAIRSPPQSALSLHAKNKGVHEGSSGWHSRHSTNRTPGRTVTHPQARQYHCLHHGRLYHLHRSKHQPPSEELSIATMQDSVLCISPPLSMRGRGFTESTASRHKAQGLSQAQVVLGRQAVCLPSSFCRQHVQGLGNSDDCGGSTLQKRC